MLKARTAVLTVGLTGRSSVKCHSPNWHWYLGLRGKAMPKPPIDTSHQPHDEMERFVLLIFMCSLVLVMYLDKKVYAKVKREEERGATASYAGNAILTNAMHNRAYLSPFTFTLSRNTIGCKQVPKVVNNRYRQPLCTYTTVTRYLCDYVWTAAIASVGVHVGTLSRFNITEPEQRNSMWSLRSFF